MNYSTEFKSIRNQVSEEEWQARLELAACYRLVDRYGMTDLIYNHITARVPGTEHLLINLYGLLYKEITASSLVKIDVEGEIIWKPDTDYGINKSGYVIHGAIHKARAGRGLRAAHPYPRRHGGGGDGLRAVAAVADLDPLRRPYRLSRLRGPGDRSRRARADGARSRAARRADHAQSRPAHLRRHRSSRRSTPCTSSNCRAARRSTPWRRAPSSTMPGENVLAHTAHLYQPGTRRPYGVLEWPAMLRLLAAEEKAPAIRRIGTEHFSAAAISFESRRRGQAAAVAH